MRLLIRISNNPLRDKPSTFDRRGIFYMLYITYRNSDFDTRVIHNVWSVKCHDVEEKYIKFMHQKAKEINVVINPHWLNIMNWQHHSNHLSIGEYEDKKKQWKKITRQWNIDKFISEILKGHKENYRNVIRF